MGLAWRDRPAPTHGSSWPSPQRESVSYTCSRHSDLFSRNWRRINLSFYGVESYPGMHFKWDELYSWTPDNLGPGWLYDGGVTEEKIQAWKSYWTPDMFTLVGKMLNGYQKKA